MMDSTIKYPTMSTAPKGKAALAHSLLLILSLEAQIMLGILPGINMPPEIIKLKSRNIKLRMEISGVISIAAKVALSKMAESMLIKYKKLIKVGIKNNRI